MMMRKFVTTCLLALPFAFSAGPVEAHGDDQLHDSVPHDDGHHKGSGEVRQNDSKKHDHHDHDHGHGDHEASHADDDGHHAKHGGQFQETEGHHGVEMVAAGQTLTFHIMQDHKPMDVTGGAFKAVVQTDAGTQILALKADGSKLSTALKSALPKGAKVVLTGKDKSGHTLQARFVKE